MEGEAGVRRDDAKRERATLATAAAAAAPGSDPTARVEIDPSGNVWERAR